MLHVLLVLPYCLTTITGITSTTSTTSRSRSPRRATRPAAQQQQHSSSVGSMRPASSKPAQTFRTLREEDREKALFHVQNHSASSGLRRCNGRLCSKLIAGCASRLPLNLWMRLDTSSELRPIMSTTTEQTTTDTAPIPASRQLGACWLAHHFTPHLQHTKQVASKLTMSSCATTHWPAREPRAARTSPRARTIVAGATSKRGQRHRPREILRGAVGRVWYVDFAWKMPSNDEKISRGCAPDPLTPGQVRGVLKGCCRAYVWCLTAPLWTDVPTLFRHMLREPTCSSANRDRAGGAGPVQTGGSGFT